MALLQLTALVPSVNFASEMQSIFIQIIQPTLPIAPVSIVLLYLHFIHFTISSSKLYKAEKVICGYSCEFLLKL